MNLHSILILILIGYSCGRHSINTTKEEDIRIIQLSRTHNSIQLLWPLSDDTKKGLTSVQICYSASEEKPPECDNIVATCPVVTLISLQPHTKYQVRLLALYNTDSRSKLSKPFYFETAPVGDNYETSRIPNPIIHGGNYTVIKLSPPPLSTNFSLTIVIRMKPLSDLEYVTITATQLIKFITTRDKKIVKEIVNSCSHNETMVGASFTHIGPDTLNLFLWNVQPNILYETQIDFTNGHNVTRSYRAQFGETARMEKSFQCSLECLNLTRPHTINRYSGRYSTTGQGHTCETWNSATSVAAHNYCRFRQEDHAAKSPGCFITTGAGRSWEYCSIESCAPQSQCLTSLCSTSYANDLSIRWTLSHTSPPTHEWYLFLLKRKDEETAACWTIVPHIPNHSAALKRIDRMSQDLFQCQQHFDHSLSTSDNLSYTEQVRNLPPGVYEIILYQFDMTFTPILTANTTAVVLPTQYPELRVEMVWKFHPSPASPSGHRSDQTGVVVGIVVVVVILGLMTLLLMMKRGELTRQGIIHPSVRFSGVEYSDGESSAILNEEGLE